MLDFGKKLGFGLMRLPMIGNKADIKKVEEMVDKYMAEGFCYFDTASVYLAGESERAFKESVAKRYDRNQYYITNKLSDNLFKTKEDIRPLLMRQLEACGVSYFDVYLMHAQGRNNYPKYKETGAYEEAYKLKQEGYIKHFGISFHDTPEYLEMILNEHPEIEVVQIQYNYLDLENIHIQSRRCYEICEKYGKTVLIMEPIKGGKLINNLPPKALKLVEEKSFTPAELALNFAANPHNVVMVLSGMSTLEQVEANTKIFNNLKDTIDVKLIEDVTKIFFDAKMIACTSCRYCVPGCPSSILIPDLFDCYNRQHLFDEWLSRSTYKLLTEQNGKASSCIRCGKCENICPQHLKIRDLLVLVKEEFEG